jgi:competence protein ComFC
VILRSALDGLASVLFPAPCRICASTLLTASRIPICAGCFASFEPIVKPFCRCCGRPFLIPSGTIDAAEQLELGKTRQTLCRLCRDGCFALDAARRFGAYNEALKKAVLLLKFEELTCLSRWFTSRLVEELSAEAEQLRADVMVPVPVHPDRQRERGYNQAEVIARPLARKLHLKQGAYLLTRTRPRPARLVFSRKEHWDSVRGAYATRKGLRVDKLRILLVDDVMTTGATLHSCSGVLKRGGAAAVLGITVARFYHQGRVQVLEQSHKFNCATI